MLDEELGDRTDVSYSSYSKPPSLINRLEKLYKKDDSAKPKTSPKRAQRKSLNAEKKMLNLFSQTSANTKKSSHHALNQLLKKLRRNK